MYAEVFALLDWNVWAFGLDYRCCEIHWGDLSQVYELPNCDLRLHNLS